MEHTLNEFQIENVFKYMERYVQKKHLLKVIHNWGIKNRTRQRDIFNDMINAVQLNIIQLPDFCKWLSRHQIDGNNYHFVYDVDFLGLTAQDLENVFATPHHYIESILNLNESNLDTVALVDVFKIEDRFVFAYIAKGQIQKKNVNEEGTYRFTYEDILYPAYVEFDFSKGSVIVVLNPTSNINHVAGVSTGKLNNFSPIADIFLKESRKRFGVFYVKKPRWITNALYALAEESTMHYNPEVERRSLQEQEFIEEFARSLLEKHEITDVSLVDSFSSEIQESFIMVLQELYKPIRQENSMGVFLQKTDQATTTIELEGKGQHLNIGSIAKIARQSRRDSDLRLLGIDIKVNDNDYRFKIESGTDHILIRPNNKFTEEEVVQHVLSKLYKHKTTALLK